MQLTGLPAIQQFEELKTENEILKRELEVLRQNSKAGHNIEVEREMFESIFDNIPVMITIYDSSAKSFRLNKEFRNVLGWSEEDLKEGDLMEKIYPDPDYRQEVNNHIQTPVPGWREWKMTAKDGSPVYTSWANIYLNTGIRIGIGIDLRQRKRAEAALRKNEQRLQGMFNTVAIGIVEVDNHDRIISMNDSTCKILGYSPKELLGKSVSEITAPEDRQRSEEMNSRLHRGDFDVFDYEKRYIRKDGMPIWVHLTVSAIRDMDGHHLNSIGTIEDISERKKFEEELLESRKRLQGIFDNAAIGIVEVDKDDRYIAVNNRICEMLGYSRDELMQKYVNDITAPEDLTYSIELNKKLFNGEIDLFDYEKRLLRKDGSRIWVHVSVSAVRDSEGRHWRTIRTIEDVSELKKNEIEIRQKNEELTRFIYTVSHDLKSPLVTIKSFASFLKESIANNDRQAQEKDINYIENAADKMGRLLDELLQLSRVGKKEKPKSIVRMETIARSAIDLVAGRIEDKKIKIIFSGPQVMLYGHSDRLVQLFMNLIDNAAKFIGDHPDPAIEIGAFPDPNKINEVILFVSDNGSGIDPRHHHKIFGLFEKLDTRQEGTGIGLALVKRIVEVHGGSIWFESEGYGKGTTFYFKLERSQFI